MSAEPGENWGGVMLDLETLGTAEDAAILEIGMVAFELPAAGLPEGLMGPEFFVRVRMDTNDGAGRKCSAETVAWWIRQWRAGIPLPDPEAGEGLGNAVIEAAEFIAWHLGPRGRLWSRGHFDAPILGHSLRRMGAVPPWKFWQVCDVRSVMVWEGATGVRPVAHNALDDAREQARGLLALAAKKRRLADAADGGKGGAA